MSGDTGEPWARLMERLRRARAILAELANGRGFHAYLAADIMDQPLSLNMPEKADRPPLR